MGMTATAFSRGDVIAGEIWHSVRCRPPDRLQYETVLRKVSSAACELDLAWRKALSWT